MSAAAAEQRNSYKGSPSRPWCRVILIGEGSAADAMELLADTGNPCAIVVSVAAMSRFKRGDGPDVSTNFGPLNGGWLRVAIPELGFGEVILGYASDAVADAARASSPDFQGLIGLPLLRMNEYGGDAESFWVRKNAKPV